MPSQKSVGTAITIVLCLVMAVVTLSHVGASDTWAPTGSMSTPRVAHTATLLPDSGTYVGSAKLLDGCDALRNGVLGGVHGVHTL